MRSRLAACILFAALLGIALPARAVDMNPGDSCAGFPAGAYRPTGGQENPDGALVVCDGTIWQPVLRYSSAGNAVMFSSTGLPAAPLHVWGEAIIGSSGLACGPAQEGAVRYTGGSPPWEYCDGAAWVNFKQPRCQDDDTGECYLQATRSNDDPDFVASNIGCGVNILGVEGALGDTQPDAFDFTDQTGADLSTLTTSDIVQITGTDPACALAVAISGDGSPEYRVCSAGDCSTVVQDWTSGTTSVMTELDYIQLRLTTAGTEETTSTAMVDVGDGSADWAVTTADLTPDAFDFTDVTGAALSTLVTSDIVQITGIDNTVDVAASGDGSPQIRVCDDASCSTVLQTWTTSATDALSNGDYVQLRLTTAGAEETTSTATADVGSGSADWAVTTEDATPDAFDFTDQTDQPFSTLVTSDIVQITGITVDVDVAASGDGSPEIRVCDDASCSTVLQTWTTSATGALSNGDYVQLRLTTAGTTLTTSTATADVGNGSADWAVTTSDSDLTPDPFDFVDVDALPSLLVLSNIVQITGITDPVNVSVSGDGSPQYRTCSDSACSTVVQDWTSASGNIANNDYLQLRTGSSGTDGITNTVTVDVGTESDLWNVTTEGTIYVFLTGNTSDGNLGGITAADDQCNTEAANAGLPGNYKAWLSDSTTSPGARFAPFSDDYVLADLTVVANGWDDLTDGSLDASIDRHADGTSVGETTVWTGTYSDGDPSSDNCDDWTSGSSSDAGKTGKTADGNWTSENENDCDNGPYPFYCFRDPPESSTPDPFDFTDVTCANTSTLYASDTAQITNIAPDTPISLSGTGSPEYRICSDSGCSSVVQTWGTADSTINDGEYVQVRLTSGASNNMSDTATITINDLATGSYTVQTWDDTPSIVLADKSCQPTDTLVSGWIQVAQDFCSPLSTSISGDSSSEYRICADTGCSTVLTDWTNGTSSINEDEYVQVRHTTASTGATQVSSTLTIGSHNTTFTTTTMLPGGQSGHKIVFNANEWYSADLVTEATNMGLSPSGGVDAANKICQKLADDAGLGGTYRAWIASSSSNDPQSTFTQSSNPYKMPDGTQVADNWTDLTDGTLDNAIQKSATCGFGRDPWTNVLTDGTVEDSSVDCSDWSSTSGNGNWGWANYTTTWWTDYSNDRTCGTTQSLYCFEQ